MPTGQIVRIGTIRHIDSIWEDESHISRFFGFSEYSTV